FLTGVRANLRLEQGDWAGAEQDARAALAQGHLGAHISRAHRWLALVALGRLQARRGDPQAATTLEEAAQWAFATGELQGAGRVGGGGARGGPGGVPWEASGGFELAMEAGHPWYAGELAFWLWRVDALAEIPALAAGPYRLLAAGDWRAAADVWETLGCPYEQAEALSDGDEQACGRAL